MEIQTAELSAVAELLRALAHNTRLGLLRTLVKGERSVGEIEQLTGVGQPTLSQQLSILRRSDIVKARRAGNLVYYRINNARLAQLRDLLEAFIGTTAHPIDPATVERFARGGGAAMFAYVAHSAQKRIR